MSEICIEVKTVDLVKATTKTNKPYEFIDLLYKNKSSQDKAEGKKVMPFGNKEVFDVLKNAEKGDVFFIGRTKNADGVSTLLTEALDLSAKVTLDLSLLALKLEKLRFLHQKLVTLPNNAIVQSYGSTMKNKEAKSSYVSIKHQPEQD